MKKRKLRNIEVSAVGYGCMGLSHGYGALPPKEESIGLIHTAFDLGCTFFDTAEGYGAGSNEELVGEALEGIRDKVVIATKLHIRNEGNLREQIETRLDSSLKRLRTDYVDIYYQHRVNKDIPVEEIAEIMGDLIKSGKIRGWGQSQAVRDEILRAYKVTPLTAVQNEYSMMERVFEREEIPACGELGIGFVPFSPLASGFLSGKYDENSTYSGDDVRRVITRFNRENVIANKPLLELLDEFAAQKDATPAQISLAWMLHKEDFIVPIPGMRKIERLEENFHAADITFTNDEYNQIEEELSKIKICGNRTDEDIAKLRMMT